MKGKDIILLVFGFIFFTFNSVGLQVLKEEPEDLSTILKYELTEDKKSYKVVGIEKALQKDIIIPETYNKLPVSEIEWSSLTSFTMKNIFIPKTVSYISNNTNTMNPYVMGIKIDELNPYYYSNDCNVIVEKSTDRLIITSPLSTIPSTVKIIGSYAFNSNNLNGVGELVIPNGIRYIESSAFYDCDGLKTIS